MKETPAPKDRRSLRSEEVEGPCSRTSYTNRFPGALSLCACVRYAFNEAMSKISRRDALFVLGAPVCAAAPQIAGSAELGGDLPPGVKAVWDLEKAYRESTTTRERLCRSEEHTSELQSLR